jgi:membrane protein
MATMARPRIRLPDVRRVWQGVQDHEIPNSASAIAFHTLFAAVPLALFALALVGFFDLKSLWDSGAKELRPRVSPPAYIVIDDTVRSILSSKQVFWLTFGAALAIWRLSAAMRATMHALDQIYGGDEDRPLLKEVRISIGLSLVIAVLLLAALGIVLAGRYLIEPSGVLVVVVFVVQWALVIAMLALAVGLTIRFGPATPQPLGWVSFGTGLAVLAWILGSVAFGLYLTKIADYSSAFGSFATVFVLLTYLYLSATALLVGAEVDTQVRRSTEGTSHGG